MFPLENEKRKVIYRKTDFEVCTQKRMTLKLA